MKNYYYNEIKIIFKQSLFFLIKNKIIILKIQNIYFKDQILFFFKQYFIKNIIKNKENFLDKEEDIVNIIKKENNKEKKLIIIDFKENNKNIIQYIIKNYNENIYKIIFYDNNNNIEIINKYNNIKQYKFIKEQIEIINNNLLIEKNIINLLKYLSDNNNLEILKNTLNRYIKNITFKQKNYYKYEIIKKTKLIKIIFLINKYLFFFQKNKHLDKRFFLLKSIIMLLSTINIIPRAGVEPA